MARLTIEPAKPDLAISPGFLQKGGEMIAYCGLNCSRCDAYLATLENDDRKREEIARQWSKMYGGEIKAEHINCEGCTSNGVKFSHCNVCAIRKCCVAKSVDHCAACDDYICETLSGFLKVAPEAGIALKNLRSQ